ncbi:MAG: Hpt domain-containing protein, partial [bacterium]
MSDLSADRELMQDFAAECGELLAELDTRLVELERSRGDIGLLDAAFRGFHTIKGSAGFLGLDSLVDLCDRSESVLDRVRRGALTLDAGVMDVILEATASGRGLVAASRQGAPSIEAPDDLLARLASVLRRARAAPDTRGTQADLEA